MKEKDAILKLRTEIPTFKCKDGCTDCCGIIFFSDWERKQIKDKRKDTSLTCPYVNSENRCDIYNDRPIVCRIFGTTESGGLKCFHGCKPDQPLTEEQAKRITTDWVEVVNR